MLFINPIHVEELLNRALAEDLGEVGDLTSQALFTADDTATGTFLAKQDGVLAGGPLLELLFAKVDPRISILRLLPDGTPLAPGRTFASVEGPTGSLLTAERTALNLIQRLSGIATLTKAFRDKIRNFPHCRVVDTRKTTPGLRALEKYAVRVGGGHNHRFGLYDAVMIKDNHIAACESITDAVFKVRSSVPHTVSIEVEVESIEQAREACSAGANVVLLDNMSPEAMREVLRALKGQAIFEASGGITLETIGNVVKSGVDCVSVGALTHSAPSLDLSFELESRPSS